MAKEIGFLCRYFRTSALRELRLKEKFSFYQSFTAAMEMRITLSKFWLIPSIEQALTLTF